MAECKFCGARVKKGKACSDCGRIEGFYTTPIAEYKAPFIVKKRLYKVERGDTLWSIARRFYGDGTKYTKILDANRDKLKDPITLYIGMELHIP